MDIRFEPHNLHRKNLEEFLERDPHLRHLEGLPLVYRSPLLDDLPRTAPGIYTLGGGRQVGKSTLLKQWMAELLNAGTVPERITYLTGELIDDHHALVRLVADSLSDETAAHTDFLVIDEVTYIRGWERGVKYLADAGLLDRTVLMLTGSDLALIRETRSMLPGRRGTADRVDFHLSPLSFGEFVSLKGRQLPAPLDVLFADFDDYLLHGGYLTAMNDMARFSSILPTTYATYSDWIRGDVLKRGKGEHYLREVLGAIISRMGSQVTWNGLAKELSIDHPATIISYVALLESLDAVVVQQALREDRLTGAPKKARKLMFSDPFIFHAVRAWLYPVATPFEQARDGLTGDPELASRLAEACAASHYARRYPTYYIKAAGEVDIAYVDEGTFWPVEVKWGRQTRAKDLKQVSRYPNGLVLDRSARSRTVSGVRTVPLPLALLKLG